MPTLDRLAEALAPIPRLPLGTFPTPLVPLSRLGAELGIDLWLKRDECSGLALGGNKTRKLEYILADARRHGHDTVVTAGPHTSNHTMMTAVAARRAGMAVHCVVGGEPAEVPAGNLLLLEYLGATLHFCPCDFRRPTREGVELFRRLGRQVVAETGGYWIPGGGTMAVAEPGYMNAVLEVARQPEYAPGFDHIVLAFGTGSTTTGLLLGLALAGLTERVWAIAVAPERVVTEVLGGPTIGELYAEAVRHFGLPLDPGRLPPHRVVHGLAEEGYAVSNPAAEQALRRMAQVEGYFLDGIYTAKAFAGVLALVGRGEIAPGSRVLFLHTGGLSMTPAGLLEGVKAPSGSGGRG